MIRPGRWLECSQPRKRRSTPAHPVAEARRIRLQGSGTVLTVVCSDEFVTVVVPSRLTSIVTAKPFVVSEVSTGIVPAGSENMLNANALPEVEVPSGEVNAG